MKIIIIEKKWINKSSSDLQTPTFKSFLIYLLRMKFDEQIVLNYRLFVQNNM